MVRFSLLFKLWQKEFADPSDERCERKRSIKDDAKVIGLNK